MSIIAALTNIVVEFQRRHVLSPLLEYVVPQSWKHGHCYLESSSIVNPSNSEPASGTVTGSAPVNPPPRCKMFSGSHSDSVCSASEPYCGLCENVHSDDSESCPVRLHELKNIHTIDSTRCSRWEVQEILKNKSSFANAVQSFPLSESIDLSATSKRRRLEARCPCHG